MKKVLHLNASSGGGAFVVAQRLSEALNAGGEIESKHLVYTGKEGNYNLWANSFLRKKYAFGLHALEKLDFLRFEKNGNIRFAFSHGITGIQIAKHPLVLEADIIHLHWINKGFISLTGLDALLALGKPVVWTCHDMWPFTGGCYYSGTCMNFKQGCGHCKYLKNPARTDLSFKVFERKKTIFNKHKNLTLITPSNWLREIGLSSGTAVEKAIFTIPNCIDTEIFRPVVKGIDTSADRKFTLMFAAVNISDKRKGFHEFKLFCESLLQKGFTNFKVLFVGDKKSDFEFHSKIEHEFTGYISDPEKMASWYNQADMYITTTNDDNLPTTVMEALATGTPVAAFSAGGIGEMVSDGETGVLVPVYESDLLAEKVIAFFNKTVAERQIYSEAARNFAVANYSKEVVVKKHLELYQNL